MTKHDLKHQGEKILLFFSAIKKAKKDKAGDKVINPLKTRCVELLKEFLTNIDKYKKNNRIVEIEVERYKKSAEKALKAYS